MRRAFTRLPLVAVALALATAAASAAAGCESVGNLGFDDGGAADGAPSPAPILTEDAAAQDDAGRDGDDGGAKDATPARAYPCGYPCDPVTDEGCGPGEGCFLRSVTRTGTDGGRTTTEEVSCVPRETSCGGYGEDRCRVTHPDGGLFRGGICLEDGVAFCMVSCERGASPESPRGCPGARTCDPAGSAGCYGYCNRRLAPTGATP